MAALRSERDAAPALLLQPGSPVWIPDVEAGFVLAEALSRTVDRFGPLYRVRLYRGGKEVSVRESDLGVGVNSREQECVPDNTQLTHLHAAALLHNARCRYEKDLIYTFTAYILLAINPYRTLPIYGRDVMDRYRGRPMGALPPHVYALADRAYRAMKSERQSQSILISGDSGAGKTETSKVVMTYLAYVGRAPGETEELGRRVLDSNPVLEAFGNAKTLRNNNSSRFGKFMKIFFSADGVIIGAGIDTYLLERSRVTQQDRGERNYHIFYQLCAGATRDERRVFRLNRAEDFAMLSQGGCIAIDGIDDASDFRRVREAMTRVGIGDEDQRSVFRTLSAILHLGNLRFGPAPNSGGESSVVQNPEVLAVVAELLEIPPASLEAALCYRTVDAAGSSIQINLRPHGAAASRNALARAIYQRLFDWLVARVNGSLRIQSALHAAMHAGAAHAAAAYIGVLDIFGFEYFERNSFEQLCINYANEKLQQHFNAQVFKQEADVYVREGLGVRQAEFVDNADTLTLLDKRPGGVLALLDEENRVPGGSDRAFCSKVHTKHAQHARLMAPPPGARGGPSHTRDEAFVVRHYAADVCYEAAGMLEKNNDALHADLLSVASSSPLPLMRVLFPSAASSVPSSPPSSPAAAPSVDPPSIFDRLASLFSPPSSPTKTSKAQAAPPSGGSPTKPGAPASGSSLRFSSVSGKFTSQLEALMREIGHTSSHFIRCVKPNNAQAPRRFEGGPVLSQLRASGMLEAVRMLHAGYPTRCSFDVLYQRYASSVPPVLRRLPPARFSEALLIALEVPRADFKVGLTRVFFRSGKLAMVDQLTNGAVGELTATVAERVRRWLVRTRWVGALWAARAALRFPFVLRRARALRRLLRAAFVARCAVRAFFRPLRRLRARRAAVRIQSAWRAQRAAAYFRAAIVAATALQATWRGKAARRRFSRMVRSIARNRTTVTRLDRYGKPAASSSPPLGFSPTSRSSPAVHLLPPPAAPPVHRYSPLPPVTLPPLADPAALLAALPPQVLALLPRSGVVDELRAKIEEQERRLEEEHRRQEEERKRHEEDRRRREQEAADLRARLDAEAAARRREREEERRRFEDERRREREEERRIFEEERRREREEERKQRELEAAALRAVVEELRANRERDKKVDEFLAAEKERRAREEAERVAREEEERRRAAEKAAEAEERRRWKEDEMRRMELLEKRIHEMQAMLAKPPSVPVPGSPLAQGQGPAPGSPMPAPLPTAAPPPPKASDRISFRRHESSGAAEVEAAAKSARLNSTDLEGYLDRIFANSDAAQKRRQTGPASARASTSARLNDTWNGVSSPPRPLARLATPPVSPPTPQLEASPVRARASTVRERLSTGDSGGSSGSNESPGTPRRRGLTASTFRVSVPLDSPTGSDRRFGSQEERRPPPAGRARAASARALFPSESAELEPLPGTPPRLKRAA